MTCSRTDSGRVDTVVGEEVGDAPLRNLKSEPPPDTRHLTLREGASEESHPH